MTTTIVQSSAGTPAAPASAVRSADVSSPSLDQHAFLKLLVAELQNQDPTKPMDSTQLVQQLSAFAEVEQAAVTNQKLTSILDSLALGQSTGLIGRTVTSADGVVSGRVESIRIATEGSVARLSDGREVVLGQGVSVAP